MFAGDALSFQPRRYTKSDRKSLATRLQKLLDDANWFSDDDENSSSDSDESISSDDQTDFEERPPFPIDFVFTWVDNTPEHARRRAKALARAPREDGEPPSDNEINRYESFGEFRHTLRSIFKHAPWANAIHILVADDQCPVWLRPDSNKARIPVHLVPHSLVYTGECEGHRETYNSQSIETHVSGIPGLAEHFLYGNDDEMIARPISWRAWFTPEGEIIQELTSQFKYRTPAPGMSKHLIGYINAFKTLDKTHPEYRKRQRFRLSHQLTPLRKSICEEAWANPIAKAKLVQTSAAKFRSNTDVYPIALFAYWGILTGRTKVRSEENAMQLNMLSSMGIMTIAQKVVDRRPILLCLNDSVQGATQRKQLAWQLPLFLDALFPEPSPVEEQEADHHHHSGHQPSASRRRR